MNTYFDILVFYFSLSFRPISISIPIHQFNLFSSLLDEILCLWIDVDPSPLYGSPAFQPMAEFFGIWHEHKRGAHHGLHEFYYHSNYILIVNVFRSEEKLENVITYANLLPSKSYLLNPHFFDKSKLPPADESKVLKASGPDISCDTVSI